MAATGGDDPPQPAADADAPPPPYSDMGAGANTGAGARTVVLDDEKVAFFMAMTAYFSNQFVDKVRVIERLAKKTMERIIATDEFVPVLARADDRKYTQQDLEARELEFDREHALAQAQAQGLAAKPAGSPQPEAEPEAAPEAAPEPEEKKRGRVRERLRTRRKRASTVPDRTSSGIDDVPAAAATTPPTPADSDRGDPAAAAPGEDPETPLLSTHEQDLASLELEPGDLAYSSEHMPREPSFESAAALHAASRVTRDDSSDTLTTRRRPLLPRLSSRRSHHRHHKSVHKSSIAVSAPVPDVAEGDDDKEEEEKKKDESPKNGGGGRREEFQP